MGDWFTTAQSQYDHATPAYLEDEYGKCTECGHDLGPIGAYCLCDCHEENED